MNPVAEGIARAVLQIFPHPLCFRCLAAEQGIKEHEARAAALVLRTEESLVSQKGVESSC